MLASLSLHHRCTHVRPKGPGGWLQCQLAKHLWDPWSVINVPFLCAVRPCSHSRVSALWPLLTIVQHHLFVNVFYLFRHLSFSLILLPAAYLLRKHTTLLCSDVVIFLPLWLAAVIQEHCLVICIYVSFSLFSSLLGKQDGRAEVRLPSPTQGMSIKLGRSLSHRGSTVSRSAAAWLFCCPLVQWNSKSFSQVSPSALHQGREFGFSLQRRAEVNESTAIF